MPELTVSSHGYVRLTLAVFRSVSLRHLFSDLDPETSTTLRRSAGASEAPILGFTEWTSGSESETRSLLSLGWDWHLDTTMGQLRYVRDGDVRSNVMRIAPGLGDLGYVATCATLGAAVDVLDWETETRRYISEQYGWHCQV
jgi:hypothetical protein